MTIPRERLSHSIAWILGLAIAAVGASLYLQDGSYFLDEASVVLSFTERGVFEAFLGPLSGGGQNFPRFYLLLIRGVREIFGPETWATRLLPHLCFLGATLLWARLLAARFGRRPALVALGLTLLAVTPSWWFYAAVVKQYSLDVLVTVGLFTVSDRSLDAVLRRRGGWLRTLALLVPILFSYIYAVSFLARLSGRVAFGLRRREARADPAGVAILALGLAVGAGVLYFTDLQHTIGREGLVKLWGNCVLSASPEATPEILRRFFAGWYLGPSEFIAHPKLPLAAIWTLAAAALIGVARVARQLLRPGADDPDPQWGSRSAGCLAGVVGVIATSWVLDYPICAGRLTLFAFFFQQILILEGLDAARELLAKTGSSAAALRAQRVVAAGVAATLIGVAGVTAFEVVGRVIAKAPLEDVRPLLRDVPADTPDLVLITACMKRQMQTLPEGLGARDVLQLPVEDWGPLLPRGEDVWIIHSRLIPGPCEKIRLGLRGMTHGFDRPDRRRETAVVYHARVRTEAELRKRRKRVLRAFKNAED